jgi:hypothetical protein
VYELQFICTRMRGNCVGAAETNVNMGNIRPYKIEIVSWFSFYACVIFRQYHMYVQGRDSEGQGRDPNHDKESVRLPATHIMM